MRLKLCRAAYLGLIVQLCSVHAQPWTGGGVGQRPPPMPLNQIPRDPEMQADMMENRMWNAGPYGYQQPYYSPQYPQNNFYPQPQQPQPPQRFNQQPLRPAYQSNNAQIIPLDFMQPRTHSASPPVRTFAVHVDPNYPHANTHQQKTISIGNAKHPPPPQNLHTGTVVGNKPHRPNSPNRRPVNTPLQKPNMPAGTPVKVMRPVNTVKSRPRERPSLQIKRLPWMSNQYPRKTSNRQNTQPSYQRPPVPPPIRRRQHITLPPPQPHPRRMPMRPPGPPLGPPMGPPLVPGPPGAPGAGSTDGPCMPTPRRAANQRGNRGGYPPVRHQPRVPFGRRYRRTVYNLTGCTCTDIQDIDPLGGDNYLTSAGRCHAFQYYCACPSTARTGSGAPPPG